ncbi:MAG: HTTM domain-containing protein [bacterium]
MKKLFAPIDAASLGMFRILFGALMAWQAWYFLEKSRYVSYFLKPGFHFTYELFPFVRPLPAPYFVALLVAMLAAAILISLGLYYRFAVLSYLLGFSYIFLLDKAYYNNHYYAIILLCFLMLFVDGTNWASLDALRRPRPAVVPYWQLFLLRAQVFVVYFFGGIAKLNSDWLHGEPMRHWLVKSSGLPVVGPLLTTPWAPYFFSWGGLAFDLSIGFLLWWRKTRLWAFFAILFFNLTNSLLFQIGVFPFLMIATATLFDEPDWPRKILPLQSPAPDLSLATGLDARRGAVTAFVFLYLGLQFFLPLRHWLYPGEVSWTEQGHYFSWHMKLRDKSGHLKFYAGDAKTGALEEVDPGLELNSFQRAKLIQRPQFIYQYAQHLKDQLLARGVAEPMVRVDAWVSLNGRPLQQAIDPTVNLASTPSSLWRGDPWILPLDPNSRPGTLSYEEWEAQKKGPREERGPEGQEP